MFFLFAVGGLVFSMVMTEESAEWVKWILLVVLILVGLGLGFLVSKLKHLTWGILGGCGGLLIGILANLAFQITSKMAWYAIVGGSALLLFVVAFKYSTQVIIFATSFIGSYLNLRGIAMYAGGFPNEFMVHEAIMDMETGQP